MGGLINVHMLHFHENTMKNKANVDKLAAV